MARQARDRDRPPRWGSAGRRVDCPPCGSGPSSCVSSRSRSPPAGWWRPASSCSSTGPAARSTWRSGSPRSCPPSWRSSGWSGRPWRVATGRSRRWSGSAAGCLLLLVPSIADVTGQLGGRGVQTLLPSVEAAYPWVLGLLGTCLFTGFGIARRRLGRGGDAPTAARSQAWRSRPSWRSAAAWSSARSRWATSSPCATGSPPRRGSARPTSIASRRRATARWGSVRPPGSPSTSTGRSTARRSGTIELAGERWRSDVRWLAYVATTRDLGLHGAAVIGNDTWLREPFAGWRRSTATEIGRADVDLHGVPRRPVAGGPSRSRVARGRADRRRPGPPMPDPGRRADLPGRVPAGRPGLSATRTSSTGSASSTTGSSSTARSGGSPAASTAPAADIQPDPSRPRSGST